MCLVRLDRRLKARGAAGKEYEKTKAEVMDVLRGHFRPEFLNRIDVRLGDFMRRIDAYIRWYNERRIKVSLGGRSPMEYRQSLGLLPV